jgi:hypothetical protein
MALPGRREPSVFDRLDGWVIHTPPQVTKQPPLDSAQHAAGAWVQPRNGLPPLRPYVYGGDRATMTDAEVAERGAETRAKAARNKKARLLGVIDCALPAFEPFTPHGEWYRELDEDGAL